MELYTLWSTIWFGCLLFWCLDFGGVCHSSLHRSLIMTGSSSRPQVWLCGKLNYSNLPMDVSIVNCLVGSWVTWCFLRLAFLQVTCFFLWLAFFDQVILVFFFIACFVRGPVSSMVHPHKLSFHSRPCLQGFWFGMSFHPSFRCPVSHTHGHSIAAKVRGTGVPAHSPPPWSPIPALEPTACVEPECASRRPDDLLGVSLLDALV